MAEIATSEVLISELSTKEVIFTPHRATVVREINTAILPGQNEITVLGLDPTVDVDSIRIEGSGPALITDIQTEIVPRKEQFEDVYPPESEDESSSDESDPSESSDPEADESDISDDDDGNDDPELQAIRDEILEVEAKLAKARNDINSSLSVLNFLNDFGTGLQTERAKNVAKLDEFVKLYNDTRTVEAERHHMGQVDLVFGEQILKKLLRKFDRRKKQYQRERREANKEARKQKEKRLKARQQKREKRNRALQQKKEKRERAKQQKRAQLARVRSEKQRFWTQNVGKVVVSLDSQTTTITPSSSRRSSVIEKGAIGQSADNQDPIEVTLRLSYIVPVPSWTSRYDLSINTPTSSARMSYRAEFQNTCSETWRDTRVTLSTSQASFGGLDVRIPTLEAWNIKLDTVQKDSFKGQPSWARILHSSSEGLNLPLFQQSNQRFNKSLFGPPPPPPLASQPMKGGLFGFGAPGTAPNKENVYTPPPPPPPAPAGGANSASVFGGSATGEQIAKPFGSAQQKGPLQQAAGSPSASSPGITFGSSNTQQQSSSLFGAPAPQSNTGGGLFGSLSRSQGAKPPPPPAPAARAGGFGADFESEKFEEETNINFEGDGDDDDDADAQTLGPGFLSHQDSVKQEHGLTTTYEIPGRRTLAPSPVCRRHVLAEMDLKSVALTYVVVPKHREAAFLRARIKNTSSIMLHQGRVGIRVDNTFVGTATIKTCAPNVHFTVSLGIDPGIEVRYSKPSVKPLSSGFFNKEDGAKFRRSCWLKNSKSTAVDLLVSDQIPITEEEKLRLTILQPRGLDKEGDEAPLVMEKSKGKGTATLRKNGEVQWTLRLGPGQDIRLVLEYEAKLPSGNEVCLA